jgi:methylenetetrahydrofolate dehydrogenase (NADP+)/methenyltetrahydrofolate cyclohydrolase
MPATLIDGKSLAASVRGSLKNRIDALAKQGVRPGLAALLAGDDPASRVYVRTKARACEEIGLHSEVHEFAQDVAEGSLLERIAQLNAARNVHGILLQLPLPGHLDADRILPAISPAKDVDGFHAMNLGALIQGRPGFVPGTPAGVMRLIEQAGVPLSGRRAVIVGRSTIVGKPLALLLLQKDATVTICHSKTADLAEVTRQADILVAAVGKPKLVTAAMVKPGACVIDVGVNRMADGKLCGDVDFAAAKEIAGSITPVPGGVGPMTVAMLMENTVKAAELATGSRS